MRPGRVVHGPMVRLLCVAMVAAGGLICLGFVAVLPVVLGDDEVTPENWVAWWGDWLPIAVILAGAGALQLAVAGWGVWSWRSAEGAG
jgi:hypothetical protein